LRMSLAKHLKPLTNLAPRPVVTWDKYERIMRHKEIWDDPKSVVHRLPKFYQERYWKNYVLADRTPVHYQPPEHRLYWDLKRKVEVETEEFPILPEHCPEQDQGLWGGEGVVKGYKESRPYTKKKVLPRHWVPHLYFPAIRDYVLYSEILNLHMRIVVTERTMRLIDACYGFDYYLLRTSDIDFGSKLALDLKRHLLIALAKSDFSTDDPERIEYLKEKYDEFRIPLEEAEWACLDLNTACRKLQDLEDNAKPMPLKYVFEQDLVQSLEQKSIEQLKDEQYTRPQKSLFGERLFGRYLNPIGKRLRSG